MSTPKEDSEELMKSLLPLAKQLLKQYHEYYPYGGYMTIDGKIVHVGGKIQETDHPESQPIIDLLKKNFQEIAQKGECKATAVIFDVRIKPPESNEKTDAIQVCLDHRDNYSIEVLFPYKITGGNLMFGKAFAQKGNDEIFE